MPEGLAGQLPLESSDLGRGSLALPNSGLVPFWFKGGRFSAFRFRLEGQLCL